MTQSDLKNLFDGKDGLMGCDWSHHQSPLLDSDISDFDFFIHKLTEGASFRDRYCGERIMRHCANKPCIVYHFFRSDTATGEQNFSNFVRNLGGFAGCRLGLAIDLETDGKGRYCPLTEHSKEELKKFLQLFFEEYPDAFLFVYTGADGWKYFKSLFKGLNVIPWIARWSKDQPKVDWYIWQFSDKPYDLDVCKGSMQDLVYKLTLIK